MDQMDANGKYNNILIHILTYFLTPDQGLEEGQEGYDTHKWLEKLQDTENYDMNPFQQKPLKKENVGSKVLCALRECLLNNRLGRGFELIRYLIKQHNTTANSVFKVGLELCHQLDPGRGRLLEQLLVQFRWIRGLRRYDLHMEYVFFLLTQKDATSLIQDALDSFKTYKKQFHAHNARNDHAERQGQEEVLHEAYRGLLFYAQWLNTKKSVDRSCESETEMNVIEEVEMAHEVRTLQVLSDRALASLKVIEGQPGVWDIFINKYVQLVEDRKWHDEAERILKVYMKDNPENPNAHRYLLDHYQRTGNQEAAYESLKMLARILPSGPQVLELYHLHKEHGEGPTHTLPLLFDLLDYSCWRNSLEPWKLLAKELLEILQQDYNDNAALAMQNCYSSRLYWWPQYHFSVHSAAVAGRSETSAGSRDAPTPELAVAKDDYWETSQWDEITPGQDASGSGSAQPSSSDTTGDGGTELEVLVCKAAVATMLNTGEDFVATVKQLIHGMEEHLAYLSKAKEASNRLDVLENSP